tara:strand:+ start:108 stop:350 length:243 start_codon:yes stop_codon:yes gene_type:complete
MKLKNHIVAKMWGMSRSALNHNGSFRSDGANLYSYNLLIGETKNGKKIIYDYTANGNFYSITTSRHVGYGKRYSDMVIQK